MDKEPKILTNEQLFEKLTQPILVRVTEQHTGQVMTVRMDVDKMAAMAVRLTK